MRRTTLTASHALMLAAGLAACAPVGTPTPPPACAAGSPMVLAQLFFGRSLPGGGAIDDAAWRDFLAVEITPRFPDGLTVLDGQGQWRAPGAARIGHEASSVVSIAAGDSADTRARLDAIRAAYRARFHQQSVGLITSPVCASF